MPKKAITRSLYDSIVIGYREAPGNHSHAARHAAIDRKTAKRAWDLGWPNRPWAPPIAKVLEKERLEADARAREEREREGEAADAVREGARQEAIEARKQEATILRGARGDVLAVLILAAELIPAMKDLVGVIKEHLAIDPKTGFRRTDVSIKDAMQLIDRFSRIIAKGVGAAEAILQLGRLDRGETTVNVGFGSPGKSVEDMEPAAVLAEMEAVQGILEGARRTGHLPPRPTAPKVRSLKDLRARPPAPSAPETP